MKVYRVYKITNNVNGKIYIGFTSRSIKTRLQEHINCALKYNKSSNLYRAIRKYGDQHFSIESVFESSDRDLTLHQMEPYYVNEYDSIQNGYNMTKGGGSFPSYIRTAEHRRASAERIKVAHLKNKNKVHVNNGSEQHFIDRSEADNYYKLGWLKGPIRSAEYSKKISKANRGKHHTTDHNEKISKSLTGKKRSISHCKNLAIANRKKIHIITTPDGRTIETNDLRQWCDDNDMKYDSFRSGSSQKWGYKGYKRITKCL